MACDDATARMISAPDVEVGPSPGRGRGVFAARRFAPEETIEICPVIALPEADARRLDATRLYDYYFGWGEDGKQAATVLGYGSLYNHSVMPNARHRKNVEDDTVVVVAEREIAPGEEICIRYETGKNSARQTVWFEVL